MMPPQGWMNDPNGFIFFRGRYHLFYQHYPYAPKWGPMHWGHSVSGDLLRWEDLPVALTPDRPYDANGCFSGSSIVHQDTLYVFYTGNAADGRQTQCLALSRDGVHFHKHEGNPVIAGPPETVNPQQFRDPYVFRREGRFYMIAGAEGRDHRGQVIVYTSDDLLHWDYLHSIADGDDSMGYMWECPNLLFFQDRAVLIVSPQGMAKQPLFDSSGDTGYFVGRFDPVTGGYTHGPFHKMDYGFDFYAAQTTADASGRYLLSAWMSTWATPVPTDACQWAGSLILPREMRLKDDRLTFHPVRELAQALTPVTTVSGVICGGLSPMHGRSCRLQIIAEDADFTIRLFCSADGQEYTALSYCASAHTLSLDLSRSGEAARGTQSVALPEAPDSVTLDICLDNSSLEVFIGDGAYVMTARVFPGPASDAIRFIGSALFRRLSLWKVRIPDA